MSKTYIRPLTPAIITHVITGTSTETFNNRARFINDTGKTLKLVGIALSAWFAGVTGANGNTAAFAHVQVGMTPALGEPLAQLVMGIAYSADVNNLVQGGVSSISQNINIGNGQDTIARIEPYIGNVSDIAKQGVLYVNAQITDTDQSVGAVTSRLLIRAHLLLEL